MKRNILDVLYESMNPDEPSDNWFYTGKLEERVYELTERGCMSKDEISDICMAHRKNGFEVGFRAAVKLLMEVGRL
ncbi:MAG: hypothetical protein ACOX7K_08100 [Oscillospiraceae bacterium]|jgi:hypothetical protein